MPCNVSFRVEHTTQVKEHVSLACIRLPANSPH